MEASGKTSLFFTTPESIFSARVRAPINGFAKDAKFDMQGFKNVLKLRAELEGQWGGNPPPPEKYIDLSYYNGAVASL